MKRITLLVVLAGCFGGGNAPQPAPGVTPLFVLPPATGNVCTSSAYIGNVAIGMVHGYAITVPYIPDGPDFNCCPNNGQCPMPDQSLAQLYVFDKQGGSDGMSFAMAPSSGDFADMRIAVENPDTPIWAYATGSSITLSSTTTSDFATIPSVGGNQLVPAGLVTDATSIYVAGWGGSDRVAVENPDYPCCGGGGTNGGNSGAAFSRVDISSNAVSALPVTPTPQFACDSTARCLVSTPNDLVYFDQSAGPTSRTVQAFSKVTEATQTLETIDNGLVPVGLVANMTNAAWAESPDYINSNNGALPQPACQIGVWDLSSPNGQAVFMTSSFSCMGLALDGTTVYTLIVAPDRGDCGGCTPTLDGIGIARFSISNPMGTFEALDLDLKGAVGPRRLVIDSTGELFLIDAATVFSIDKNALAGKHDFMP
ncbi:MAG TPA: hypothetical protein VMJ10_04070 [Kofleriaceae bacterium]|nr:hypothetical protein [Kofleriaceae bacterium]